MRASVAPARQGTAARVVAHIQRSRCWMDCAIHLLSAEGAVYTPPRSSTADQAEVDA